jgi:hypothetical protein
MSQKKNDQNKKVVNDDNSQEQVKESKKDSKKQSKEQSKEETKKQSKEEIKKQSKEETKKQSKEETKKQSKEETKKQTKEETKKKNTSVGTVDEETKDDESSKKNKVSYEERVEQVTKHITDEYNTVKERLKALGNTLTELTRLHNSHMKKCSLKKKSKRVNTQTGFNSERKIYGELAEFIGVEDGTSMRGPKLTQKVWEKMKELGLYYKSNKGEEDRRVLRTNDKVSALFDIPKSVNDATDHQDLNGLNFRTIQKYIKNAENKTRKGDDLTGDDKSSEKVLSK